MPDYINKIKFLVDSLTVVSQPVSQQELIDHTLNGLGRTYILFAISMYTMLDDLSVADVYNLFLNYEYRCGNWSRTPFYEIQIFGVWKYN